MTRPAADLVKYSLFRMKAREMAAVYQATFAALARDFGVTIVAGSILLPAPRISNGALEIGKGRLYNVTAVYGPDGRAHDQLTHKVYPISSELPFTAKSVIVHRKGVTEVKKILEGESGDVFLGFGSGEVLFKCGTAALYVREIDEEYPDYRSVIPDSFSRELTVSGAELVAAMKRVLPLADPAVSVVKLEVRPETLHVSSTNPQSGTGETTIFADYSGETFSVGFNHRYLLESASAVQSEQLRIRMNEPGTPCEVVPLDPEEKAIYVLMPIEEA